MRTRKMALTMAVLAGGVWFAAAGCGSSAGGGRSVAVAVSATSGAPAQDASATVAPTATAASSTPTKPAKSPGRPPMAERTTSSGTGSAPPWCKLADLRFSLSLGSGGVGIPGSLLMTNTSGRRCALSGYLLLTWRDANGTVIAVSVNKRPDPQTPHTVAIAPGARGIVGLGWQRYKSEPPPVLCTPVPKTLDVRLPPTVQNPHPETGPAKRISWFTGDSAGMCGPKVDMLPVDAAP